MNITIKKAKVWSTGTSAVITVPNAFIESGLIKIGHEYDFEVIRE